MALGRTQCYRGQSCDGAEDDPDSASTASEDASDDDVDDSYHDDNEKNDEYVPEADSLAYSDCTVSGARTVLQLSTLLNGSQWQLSNPRGRRAARVDYRLKRLETPEKTVAAKKPTAAKKCRPPPKVGSLCS